MNKVKNEGAEDDKFIQQTPVRCDKHTDSPAELFCKSHNTLICYKCAFIEHSSHPKQISPFTSIQNYAKAVSIQLTEIIDRLLSIQLNIDLLNNPQHTIRSVDFITLHDTILQYLCQPILSKSEIDAFKKIRQVEQQQIQDTYIESQILAEPQNFDNLDSSVEICNYDEVTEIIQPPLKRPRIDFVQQNILSKEIELQLKQELKNSTTQFKQIYKSDKHYEFDEIIKIQSKLSNPLLIIVKGDKEICGGTYYGWPKFKDNFPILDQKGFTFKQDQILLKFEKIMILQMNKNTMQIGNLLLNFEMQYFQYKEKQIFKDYHPIRGLEMYEIVYD